MVDFMNGYWAWDEENECIEFYKYSNDLKESRRSSSIIAIFDVQACMAKIRFKDIIDSVSQAYFKRYYRRKVKPKEPDVVTIQDIKDVVIFSAIAKDLSAEIIRYIHLPAMDKFFRAAIIYFQYFFMVWEFILSRRIEGRRKIGHRKTVEREINYRDNLSDLRTLMAKEYGCIICGMGDTKKFHHIRSRFSNSFTEQERQQFESFIAITAKVVWCALQRRNFSLIETELGRLLRSSTFNLVEHRSIRGEAVVSPEERAFLLGKATQNERTLLQRSPLIQELLYGETDYKLLAIGIQGIMTHDKRYKYLEIAYSAPEELLLPNGVGVGLLGFPRNRLDPLLKPKERQKEDVLLETVIIPQFIIPPKEVDQSEEIKKMIDKLKCPYNETVQTITARKKQCKVWIRYLAKAEKPNEKSFDDSVPAKNIEN